MLDVTAAPMSPDSDSDSSRRAALEAQRKKDRAMRRQRIRMLLDGDPLANREMQMSNPNLIATPQEMEFVSNLRTRQLKNMTSQSSTPERGTPERGTPDGRSSSLRSGGRPRGSLLRSQSLGTGFARPQWNLPSDSSPCNSPPPSGNVSGTHLAKSMSLREHQSRYFAPCSGSSPLRESSNSHPRMPKSTSLGHASPQSSPQSRQLAHDRTSEPASSRGSKSRFSASDRESRGTSRLARSQSLDPGAGLDADVRSCLRQHQQSMKSLSVGSPVLNSVRCPVPKIPRSGTLERGGGRSRKSLSLESSK